MCIHDMYVGHVPHTFTEDAVHSFLRDVNIEHIIRVSKLLTNEKHAGFRVIIGDKDIKNTLYGTKKDSSKSSATIQPHTANTLADTIMATIILTKQRQVRIIEKTDIYK